MEVGRTLVLSPNTYDVTTNLYHIANTRYEAQTILMHTAIKNTVSLSRKLPPGDVQSSTTAYAD
jgi:hypothetical protein